MIENVNEIYTKTWKVGWDGLIVWYVALGHGVGVGFLKVFNFFSSAFELNPQ